MSQLPWCVATFNQNAYNYATTFNGKLQKISGHFDTNAKTTASYKAQFIDIDCGFKLRCEY